MSKLYEPSLVSNDWTNAGLGPAEGVWSGCSTLPFELANAQTKQPMQSRHTNLQGWYPGDVTCTLPNTVPCVLPDNFVKDVGEENARPNPPAIRWNSEVAN
jgi:hypothetical protein